MSLNAPADFPQEVNWPTTQTEAWKYTDLQKLAEGLQWNPPQAEAQPWLILPHDLLHCCSNHDSSGHSSDNRDALARIIQSHSLGGWKIHISAGLAANEPLRVIYARGAHKGCSAYTHHIHLEPGARLTLIEEFEEEDPSVNESLLNHAQDAHSIMDRSMTLHHLSVHLEQGAELKLIRLFLGSESHALAHQIDAFQESDTRFEVQTVAIGSGTIRNNVHVNQLGNGCFSGLLGLSVAFGGGHIDQYSQIRHQALQGNSHQHYKAIAAPNSTTVFNGVLKVEPQAQETNAYQRSSNLMLDPMELHRDFDTKNTKKPGRVHTKPELQIFADNVKCSHGATMGKLNPDSIFYLQSRGLSHPEAQRMLTLAFAREIIDQMEDESLQSKIMEHLDLLHWL
jgi:Fe-S cluster assembly protein SufD